MCARPSPAPTEVAALHRLLPTAAAVDLQDVYADLDPPDRPWTVLGMVGAVDGGATVAGRSADLGGAGDLAAFRALRTLADVVLVGAGTVRAEDYGPAVPRNVAARRARGQADAPRIAVVTGSADLDPASRLFTAGDAATERPLVLTTERAPAGRRAALRDVAEVVVVGEDRVTSAAALAALHERDMVRVLCEGGPRLNAQLLGDGVVDELFLTIAPTLVGTDGPRIVGGALAAPVDLVLHELRVHGGELVLRYRVLPPG